MAYFKRGLFVALLLVAYVYAWRPARAWIASHGIYPALESIHTSRAERYQVKAEYLSVRIYFPDDDRSPLGLRPTGGILFVLPAVMLLLLFPEKPYLVYLFAYHLILGACMIGAVAVGIGWAEWGFAVYRFLIGYFLKATSLAAPLLPFLFPAHRRNVASSLPE